MGTEYAGKRNIRADRGSAIPSFNLGNQPIELARRARGEELNEGKGDCRVR